MKINDEGFSSLHKVKRPELSEEHFFRNNSQE